MSFLLSLVPIMSVMVFQSVTDASALRVEVRGEVTAPDGTVTHLAPSTPQGTRDTPAVDTASTALSVAAVLCLGNIPTAIYLIIYFIEREKFRKKRQMERMSIQDL